MKISIYNTCTDFDSYRAARVKSLFNVESGANFNLELDLPIEDDSWKIGVIVGPSGSGKSSIGQKLGTFYDPVWPEDKPIIDAISGEFNHIAGALSAVGLGSVPSWLRPYGVLSNGEKFRATMARLVCDAPDFAVVDEFTSVVDRQIAQIGAGAFAKSWRKTGKKVVLLSCHYDILDWINPDWVFDTSTGQYERGYLRRRPSLEMHITETNWSYWPLFEKHHYLKLPHMIASTCYVASINKEPVAHVAFAPRPGLIEGRASRLVVMPEWQGAGVGMAFLNAVSDLWKQGLNRYQKPMPTLFHTSHPGLANALRNDPKWTQVSAKLHGDHKMKATESINKSAVKNGFTPAGKAGHGGHFRAIQGFRFIGN